MEGRQIIVMAKLTNIPTDERTLRQIMIVLETIPELKNQALRRKIAEKIERVLAARVLRVAAAFMS